MSPGPSRDPLAVHRRDLLGIFAHHKVAANLLMLMMLLSGVLALERLNVQFFPRFALDIVTVRVLWTGASAEDVEVGITQPLEQRLRAVDNLHKLTSTSAQGVSSITLEFADGIDPLLALDQVRRFVDEFRNFPADAEKPEVALATRYETVARVLITGLDDPGERRNLARRFETELLDAGIDRVDIEGLPQELIAIQLDHGRLAELGLGLDAVGERRLLAITHRGRLKQVLKIMLDENEFLSQYGIRALSRFHEHSPYVLEVDGTEHRVDYEPAESQSSLFGGNSNWRGPIWFPVNYLLIESLQKFHHYYGNNLVVECPTGSGNMMNLWQVAEELSRRMSHIFLRDKSGRRPVYGNSEKFQTDPHFRDHILFYEYFHGDNGTGVGASHQTGWTGLVAKLLQQSGE